MKNPEIRHTDSQASLKKRRKRLIIIHSFIALAAVSIFMIRTKLFEHAIEKAKTNPYPLIDISRNFIPQEDFIVNIQPLRESLNEFVAEHADNKISIYFEFLNTGANIQINNELRFRPVSLIKVPVAMAALKKVERGEWRLQDRLVLMEEDRNEEYGDLYKKEVGTTFTIHELLEKMLTVSDNTAYYILLRNIEPGEMDEYFDHLGLEDLFDNSNEINAKEYSRIFRSLYTSSFLEREYSEMILQFLAQTPFVDSLDAGIPDEITFSHKIGENGETKEYLDSGIVYLPQRPYMLTVMIGGKDKKEVEKIMKIISAEVYEYLIK